MFGRRRAAHGRRSHTAEDDLRSLGEKIPQLDPAMVHALAKERAHRVVPRALVVVPVVVVVGLLALQWFRPIAPPVFRPVTTRSLELPGAVPSLPWPSSGSAAMSMAGAGSLGQSGSPAAVPVASLAKVLTAYVVLRDHPLAPGSDGPVIAVQPVVVVAYQAGTASGESELAVTSGEQLSEMQALQGLLIVGANDMATLLADWDAGSLPAFVVKMNATARSLGMDSTHITDPSGLDPATVSTPADLIRLGQAAMAVPALASVVALPQVNLPSAGTVYNLDSDLGTDGFVGIKTGNESASGGCFLFEARQSVAGQELTLVGVVLGQGSASPTSAALGAADALVRAAFASADPVPLVRSGQVVGRLVAPWGASAAVTAVGSPTVVAWSGLRVPVSTRVRTASSGLPAGARVGVLSAVVNGQRAVVGLHTPAGLAGPSPLWRLTRL